jgi:5-methyltetrahydrofolate--homocysteine methyltransferase
MDPVRLLNDGLIVGMQAIGRRFAANEVFIPEVLISARAMQAGVDALKPALANRDVPSRGTFVIGTVRGDLHDIGKNIVAIMFRGVGWKVIDLGTDCSPESICDAVADHPGCVVGLSALLTTTMVNMGEAVAAIRARSHGTLVLVGGAPVDAEFAAEIGADAYAADPHQAIQWLDARLPEE